MMDEICAHIVDIVANSVTAGSRYIRLMIGEYREKDLLTLKIVDDGRGMDEETAARVVDPFFSTKAGKKVGLGVSLLKGTAETCEGNFSLRSAVGEGTGISASFRLSHPDLPPLGSLRDTFLILAVGNPDVDFYFEYAKDDKVFALDTKELRAELAGVPINHPEIVLFLSNYLDANL
jgi:hypothetical protein